MSFLQDLQAGKEKEVAAIPLIKKFYKRQNIEVDVWLNEAEDLTGKRECDLYDSLGTLWEIKLDRLWNRTGNVFLEHKALGHSNSKWVIYFLEGEKAYLILRETLLDIIRQQKYKVVSTQGQPDNEGTLLPVDELRKIGEPIDD